MSWNSSLQTNEYLINKESEMIGPLVCHGESLTGLLFITDSMHRAHTATAQLIYWMQNIQANEESSPD